MIQTKKVLLFMTKLVTFLVLTGCNDNSKLMAPRLNPIETSALGMNFNNVGFVTSSDSEAELLAQIENNNLKSETLIEAFLAFQKNAYLAKKQTNRNGPDLDTSTLIPSESEILNKIKFYLQGINLKTNLNQLKNLFEKNMESDLGELIYNKKHSSLWAVLQDQKIQSYSGTNLFEVIRRFRSERQFNADNGVVIFEKGHVLPGYMVWTGKDNYDLIGIEMTVRGRAEKKYGSVKNLSDVRVVESNIYLVTQIFESKITNVLEVFKNGLVLTAKKYGIPLDKIEESIPDPLLRLDYKDLPQESNLTLRLRLSDSLSSSLFSFGYSDIPDGDLNSR